MADWRMKIIAAETERLIGLAAEDTDLRRQLRALAGMILDATAEPPTREEGEPARSTDPADAASPIAEESPAPGEDRAEPRRAREPLKTLTLGRPAPTQKAVRSPSPAATISVPARLDEEIVPMAARCRRKAAAARWAARRRHRLGAGHDSPGENAPSDPALAEWADRLTDCFYWRSAAEELGPAEISSLEDVGGCFEAVAGALALAGRAPEQPRALERILPLIAEAQSALRAALRQIQAPDDPDQLQVFEWLKATAARHRIYIKRFMRADDSADSTRWPELLARIEALRARSGQRARKRSRHESLIQQLRARLEVVRGSGATEPEWRAVMAAVEDLVSDGVPPSDRELRELLLPVINELPDFEDWPPGFRLVLREIDRFLATHAPTAAATAVPEPTAEVKEAARLLGGRSLALIGGSRRREAQQALERALGLKELIWLKTKEHQSIADFEPIIARRDVALVLLAIRWSSHAFGDVKLLCDRHGKPLVRLPGGYNPNQVAAQILSQCSGQLGETT